MINKELGDRNYLALRLKCLSLVFYIVAGPHSSPKVLGANASMYPPRSTEKREMPLGVRGVLGMPFTERKYGATDVHHNRRARENTRVCAQKLPTPCTQHTPRAINASSQGALLCPRTTVPGPLCIYRPCTCRSSVPTGERVRRDFSD